MGGLRRNSKFFFRKVALKFSPTENITSRFKEVQFPRKFRPREDFPSNLSSELEKFTELKFNLGGKVCKTLEPLNRC